MVELKRRNKKSSVSEIVDNVEAAINSPIEKDKDLQGRQLFSTGSTLLNLALSETTDGGFCAGTSANIIGDSQAGKSFLAWSCIAEASYAKAKFFKDLHSVYDDAEFAMKFDLKKLFGAEIIDKVDLSSKSKFVQDWYENVLKFLNKNQKFLYVLDSYDAMEDVHEADADPQDVGKKGGYKTGKATASSQIFRKITGLISNLESLLIIVSQTRDNLGFGSQFKPKVRNGGNALDFYSSYIMWLSIVSHIKRRNRDVGVNVEVKISKNKYLGKLRTVKFPIIFDYGIDDVTSMIEFLIDEEFWNKPKGKQIIETESPFIDGKIETIIDDIEKRNLEGELKRVVYESWMKIEDEIKTTRKKKY